MISEPIRERDGRNERPVRVLKFITGFGIGGSERQTVRLVRGLTRRGADVQLACFRKQGPLLEQVRHLPCEHVVVDSFRNPRALAAFARFVAFLRREKFDVVHATGLHPNFFAVPAARLAGVPAVIASIRDLGDPWTPLERRLENAACRLAHEIHVNAAAIRDRLVREGHRADRIRVIHNAVDRLDTPGGADPLAAMGVPPEAPVIGVVARLVRVKGIEYFLQAAARLAPRFPEARFVLVGGPIPGGEPREGRTYEQELHQLVRENDLGDRVLFLGDREDVVELLPRFTVSVLPSLSEGLPNALLESLSAGVPSVATRVGGCPEIVEPGVSGLLVPPADADALATAIARLLDDPELAARLAAAGRERTRSLFSEQRMVDRTARSYGRLLQGRGLATCAREALRSSPSDTRPWSWNPAWRKR